VTKVTEDIIHKLIKKTSVENYQFIFQKTICLLPWME